MRRSEMKKLCLVVLAGSVISAGYVHSQELKSGEYIVKKSDTLWGISGSKLQDPFLWPKLWNLNPHIKNPNRIYPGDKITMPSGQEPAAATASPASAEKTKDAAIKIKPKQVQGLSAAQNEEHPTVHKGYIINQQLLLSSGWISDEVKGVGEIFASPMQKGISGKGDSVYLKLNQGETSQRFIVIRDYGLVRHPKTDKIMGHLIRVTGILAIKGMENNHPKAEILASFEDIQTGDALLPYKETVPPVTTDIIKTPDVAGYIVHSSVGALSSAKGDVVFLDRGLNDGLQPGDVFAVFSDKPVEREIGTIQIVALQPATSSAVILSSTEDVVTGAKWGQKK